MSRIYDSLLKFFAEEWFFTQNDEETFLKLLYEGKNGEWNCYAQALEEQEQFAIYSIYPTQVPEDKRQAVAELITRINYGLISGNFEMDFNDGEIRFKTSLDAKKTELTTDLIKPVVYMNVAMMDRCFPALVAVLENCATPQQAFDLVEHG